MTTSKTSCNYLLSESIANTIAIYMILKQLLLPFNEWEAYKLGIINDKGEKIKQAKSAKELEAWDMFSRFVCNFKRILGKFVGKSQFAHYITAAYLLKDSVNYFYLEKNQQHLNETLLEDFTCTKQLEIHNLVKKLNGCSAEQYKVNEDSFELLMNMYLPKVKNLLSENSKLELIVEDSAGSVAGDVAQFTPRLKPDMQTRGIPTFHVENENEFMSFSKGRKTAHHWKKHTSSDKIRTWANQNKGKSFYVHWNGNFALVNRSKDSSWSY